MSTIIMNLKYFNGVGRAEPIRILLHAAASKQNKTNKSIKAVEWTDTRIPFTGWPEEKKLAPLGRLPTLSILDDEMMPNSTGGGSISPFCQTTALIRFMAKKVGYYPADIMDALIVDEALETINELIDQIPFVGFKDEEDKKAQRQAFQAGALTNVATFLESRIQTFGAGKYFVASGYTAADSKLSCFVRTIKLTTHDTSS